MTIELIDNSARFDALRGEWSDLLADCAAPSPFLTWEWLHAWWTHLRGSRRLALLAVRDGERLVAIAPWAATRARLPFFWRWEFLGTGAAGSDYLDVIARRGCEARAIAALAGFARQRSVALHLDRLPANSLVSRLAASLADADWTTRQVSHGVCPFIRLSGHSWDSFLATIGPANRATTRRRLRGLERKFAMEFEAVRGDQERQSALEKLFAFHDERFGARGTAFRTRALRDFHRDFAARAQQSGWLRLYTLRLDGDIAAVMYGFGFNDRFYFYQHGYDQRFQALGVGRAILDMSIRAAIEEQVSEFDLLFGSEAYKSAWTSEQRPLARIDVFPAHRRGRLQRRAAETERMLRALARRVLFPHAAQTS